MMECEMIGKILNWLQFNEECGKYEKCWEVGFIVFATCEVVKVARKYFNTTRIKWERFLYFIIKSATAKH